MIYTLQILIQAATLIGAWFILLTVGTVVVWSSVKIFSYWYSELDMVKVLFAYRKALRDSKNPLTIEKLWISVDDMLPAVGQRVILQSDGVIQNESYRLYTEDEECSASKYYWYREELENCPAVKSGDKWIPWPTEC